MNTYTDRYTAYARAHGYTPDEMMERDAEQWPGGIMTGFILWIDEKKRAFQKVSPESFIGNDIADQKAWDKFLGSNIRRPVVMQTAPFFRTACFQCGRSLDTSRDVVIADLNGEAFKAFYCEECFRKGEGK